MGTDLDQEPAVPEKTDSGSVQLREQAEAEAILSLRDKQVTLVKHLPRRCYPEVTAVFVVLGRVTVYVVEMEVSPLPHHLVFGWAD